MINLQHNTIIYWCIGICLLVCHAQIIIMLMIIVTATQCSQWPVELTDYFTYIHIFWPHTLGVCVVCMCACECGIILWLVGCGMFKCCCIHIVLVLFFVAECHDFLVVVDNITYRAMRRAHISLFFYFLGTALYELLLLLRNKSNLHTVVTHFCNKQHTYIWSSHFRDWLNTKDGGCKVKMQWLTTDALVQRGSSHTPAVDTAETQCHVCRLHKTQPLYIHCLHNYLYKNTS